MYNPTTDFLALWRNNGSSVSKLDMPGLDYVIAALARAGAINVAVAATAPVANQSTTAWLKTAVPSSSAEGTFWLWDATASAYAAATPGLFLAFLQACGGESGISWWVGAGVPSNATGLDGDMAIRTDEPGGIYGPKAAGAWPVTPLPGSSNVVSSAALDNTFGTAQGQIIYRGASLWQSLPISGVAQVLASQSSLPAWATLSTLFDSVFGSAQGSVLYRDAATWNGLGPGAATQVLTTNGPGSNPTWENRTSEFSSGTTMLFYQASAPTGWTKQTAVNDAGLRVVSGTGGGVSGGTAFSTVFSQTATGGHALSVGEMPSHSHSVTDLANVSGAGAGAGGVGGGGSFGPPIGPSTTFSIAANGGGGAHTHPISLVLSYIDVIICSKN